MVKKIFNLIFVLLTISIWHNYLFSMEAEDIAVREGDRIVENRKDEGSSGSGTASDQSIAKKIIVVQIGGENFEVSSDILEKINALRNVLDFPQEGEVSKIPPQAIDSLFPDPEDPEAYKDNQENFRKILELLNTPEPIKDTLSTYSIEELLSLLKCVHKLDVPEILEEGIQVCADYIQNQEEIGDEPLVHLEKLRASNTDLFNEIMGKIKFMLPVPHSIVSLDKDEAIQHICFNKTASKVAFCTLDTLYVVRCEDNKILQEIAGNFCNLQFMHDDRLLTMYTKIEGVRELENILVWEFFDNGTRKILPSISGRAALLTPDNKVIVIGKVREEDKKNFWEKYLGFNLRLSQIDKSGNYCNDPLFLGIPLGVLSSGLVAALSADGKFIALASHHNKYVYLWELEKLDKSKINEPIIIFQRNVSKNYSELELFFNTKKYSLYIIEREVGKKNIKFYTGSFDKQKLVMIPNILDYVIEKKPGVFRTDYLNWKKACKNRVQPVAEFARFDKTNESVGYLYKTSTSQARQLLVEKYFLSFCLRMSHDRSRMYLNTFQRNNHSHSLYGFNFNKGKERQILYLPLRENVRARDAIFSFDVSKDETLLAAGTAGKLIVWKFLGSNTIEMSPSTLRLLHALNKAHSANEKLHLCPYSNPSLYSIYNESNSDFSHFVNNRCSLKCYWNNLKERIQKRPLLSTSLVTVTALGATAVCASGYFLYKKLMRKK